MLVVPGRRLPENQVETSGSKSGKWPRKNISSSTAPLQQLFFPHGILGACFSGESLRFGIAVDQTWRHVNPALPGIRGIKGSKHTSIYFKAVSNFKNFHLDPFGFETQPFLLIRICLLDHVGSSRVNSRRLDALSNFSPKGPDRSHGRT